MIIKYLRYRKYYQAIKKSNLFDTKHYLFTYSDVRKIGLDPIKHYIKFGADEGRNPSKEFDTNYYFEANPDVREVGINPLAHYILYGKNEKRTYSRPKLKKKISKQIKKQRSSNVEQNQTKILEAIKRINHMNTSDKDKELMINFINGKLKKINIKNFFSSDDYLAMYPDIKTSGANPLLHYLLHGRREGRLPFVDIEKHILKGNRLFDSSKETILLVSHESSATGAPLLGLNIGKWLSDEYNLIHYIMKKSNIHNAFFDDSFLVIENINVQNSLTVKKLFQEMLQRYNLKCVVCNSVVTYPILEIASDLKIPTVSLIHEFSEYTKPKNRMLRTIVAADKVVLPAKIIQNSIMEQIHSISGLRKIPLNLLIQPQGKLPYLPEAYGEADTQEQILNKLDIDDKSEYKIIVASGFAQIRKGLDLFIYTARYIKQYYKGKCKIVWVGDGYNPEHDFSYSLWLSREIKHLGLENDFVFLEHQKSLDSIFELADMFCLSSRMDPFPNVVIDALEANLPIACFRDASGSVEFLEENRADCLIADYLDTHQLGKMIAEYMTKSGTKSSVNRSLAHNKLNFDKYAEFIVQMIKEAQKENFENKRIFESLKDSEYFDNDYVQLFDSKEKSLFYHILIQRKGLYSMNPNPNSGFSNLKWILEHNDSGNVALFEASKKGIFSTHKCKIVPLDSVNKISFKFAVHLHLYYTDLADEFCVYFKNLPSGYDLYITVVNQEDVEEVYRKFKDCAAQNIEVIVVENIGRDVAPMIFDLKDKILAKYEVVGHFHSKKSISTNNDMGNRWRTYLLDNLIGDKNIAKSVLSLFNDKSVGLVFAEDRHYMDIGDNKKYLDELCSMMNINKVNETPLFPLGNMYWARVDAVKQMFLLDKNKIIQPEPLPYDGSYMHAIERITPNLVENNNFKFITVYNRGAKW